MWKRRALIREIRCWFSSWFGFPIKHFNRKLSFGFLGPLTVKRVASRKKEASNREIAKSRRKKFNQEEANFFSIWAVSFYLMLLHQKQKQLNSKDFYLNQDSTPQAQWDVKSAVINNLTSIGTHFPKEIIDTVNKLTVWQILSNLSYESLFGNPIGCWEESPKGLDIKPQSLAH